MVTCRGSARLETPSCMCLKSGNGLTCIIKYKRGMNREAHYRTRELEGRLNGLNEEGGDLARYEVAIQVTTQSRGKV